MKTQLDSYEAQLELASSSVALNVFSDTFLTVDVKEFEELIQTYTDLFSGLTDTSDLSTILAKAKMQLLEFATKGIARKVADYNRANDFVSERTADTFTRINGYWEMLLKNK